MSDINSIKDRVRALLAKATDAGATADEAASAMNMARKLMSKYELTEAELAAAKEADFKTASWHYTKDRKGNTIVHPVDRYCSVNAGKFCGVKPYISDGDITAFGFESDVELFTWMLSAFRAHAEADWLKFKRFQLGTKRLLDIKEARKSFMHGFCDAVNARLSDWLYREVPSAGESRTANALVIKKLDIVERELEGRVGRLVKNKRQGSRGSNTAAAGAGHMSGSSANVGRGMGQSYIAIGAK